MAHYWYDSMIQNIIKDGIIDREKLDEYSKICQNIGEIFAQTDEGKINVTRDSDLIFDIRRHRLAQRWQDKHRYQVDTFTGHQAKLCFPPEGYVVEDLFRLGETDFTIRNLERAAKYLLTDTKKQPLSEKETELVNLISYIFGKRALFEIQKLPQHIKSKIYRSNKTSITISPPERDEIQFILDSNPYDYVKYSDKKEKFFISPTGDVTHQYWTEDYRPLKTVEWKFNTIDHDEKKILAMLISELRAAKMTPKEYNEIFFDVKCETNLTKKMNQIHLMAMFEIDRGPVADAGVYKYDDTANFMVISMGDENTHQVERARLIVKVYHTKNKLDLGFMNFLLEVQEKFLWSSLYRIYVMGVCQDHAEYVSMHKVEKYFNDDGYEKKYRKDEN